MCSGREERTPLLDDMVVSTENSRESAEGLLELPATIAGL